MKILTEIKHNKAKLNWVMSLFGNSLWAYIRVGQLNSTKTELASTNSTSPHIQTLHGSGAA